MKILIVINDYLNTSNGMCISTQRFVKEFKQMGHEVRIVTNNRYGETEYPVEVLRIPVLASIIEKEGYTFAKIDREKINEAVKWADLVHVEDPFFLCGYAASETKRQGKPLTGTFHMYPENMTYAVHIGKSRHINDGFMKGFLVNVYDKCDCIQCPTSDVKKRLLEFHEDKKLFVISNGIDEEFIGNKRKPRVDTKDLRILSVGRYAVEKNQKILLEAINLSKYKEHIKLTLAGKGPLEDNLKKEASELGIDTEFKFYEQNELKEKMLESDLYVHCADIEVEGMSCMEAFALGCVPIISNAKLSSTKNYGLTDKNLFEAENIQELANRIDYFYENPNKIEELSIMYMDFAKTLSIKNCAKQVLDMMFEAIKMANNNGK